MVTDTCDISKIVCHKSQQDNQITNIKSTRYINDKLNEIQRNSIIVQKKQTEQRIFLFVFLILCPSLSQDRFIKTVTCALVGSSSYIPDFFLLKHFPFKTKPKPPFCQSI